MRINVYSQEITDRLELVTATADNTGSKFVGIRFYLDSADSLKPPKHPDDDSSAVTFWVRSGKMGYKPGDAKSLADLLRRAAMILDEGPLQPLTPDQQRAVAMLAARKP